MFLLSIEIKMKKKYFNVIKSLGWRLGDTAGERRPPNVARTKHVSHELDPTPFGERFGNAAGDTLIDTMPQWHNGLYFCATEKNNFAKASQ
jgi:hypothetical protein